ncbi:MAG: anti-sigma factor [Bacteroidota bacterium]
MNKKEFLNTGLLEQYALGLTTEEEALEVERYLKKFPELETDVRDIRSAIEKYATQQAIPPPPGSKSRLMNTLGDMEFNEKISDTTDRVSRANYRWLSAAILMSFAGLIAMMILYAKLQSNHQQLTKDYAALSMECKKESEQAVAIQEMNNFIQNPNTTKLGMGCVADNNTCEAIAFWNRTEGKGYVNLGNLPTPPEGKQYQIWADVDHVMINAGLLENTDELQTIAYIDNAESLNITLEPIGGSPEPTVSDIVAVGLF